MLIINLDEKSREPKYKQIIQQVIEKINSQTLSSGDKLPSTRNLAQMTGVHRSTAALAYQELWSLGYVDLKPNSCPVVRERKEITGRSSSNVEGAIRWPEISSSDNIIDRFGGIQSYNDSSLIDFSTMNIDISVLPFESFRCCLNEAIYKIGGELFEYGDPMGYYPLRKYICKHLENHGVSVLPEEIMITNGTQQAIDLVLKMIAIPGKKIVIESPTYKEIFPLLDLYKLVPVEIPVNENGIDLDLLEEKILTEKPVLIYTMPNFQNPTSITTSQESRERLISISEKYRIPIIEDGFQEEMKYFGKTALPVKSMDKHKTVIYCSSFSKVLFPGVRVGWIAADSQCIKRLASLRHFSEISPSMILQAGLFNFCSKGYYDRHISRLNRTYKKRMKIAIDSLNKYMDKNLVYWHEPSGGYLIWIKLLGACRFKDVERIVEQSGVRVSMGDRYFYTDTDSVFFRLSISSLNENSISEGIRRLERAVDKIFSQGEVNYE
ncbi:MAG: DNA-binding domain- and aminotransferase transcriptional regulator [Firmicutes bacterium]|nr:DNA-binding domain- and aminotransferase transcriptional regulator [Bacillota bacterium]